MTEKISQKLPSSHEEQLALSRSNISALSTVSTSIKVSTQPTFSESYILTYEAMIADLKQKLSDAHDLIDNHVSTINTLKNEITHLEQTKVELSNENDQIVNDVLDIIEENEEMMLMLEKNAEETRLFQQENKSLLEERSILEDKLEKKREQILDHDELNELVKIVRQPIKQKLKQCVSEKHHLEFNLKRALLERDSVYKAMDATTKEMESIVQDQDKKIQFLKSQIVLLTTKLHHLESKSVICKGEREKKQEIDNMRQAKRGNNQTYYNTRSRSVRSGGDYWFY